MEYVSLKQNMQKLFKLIASYKKNPVLGIFWYFRCYVFLSGRYRVLYFTVFFF